MKNSPDITIIIVNTNDKDYLKNCLVSLVRQKTENLQLEIVVVDNGSTDGSRQLIETRFPQVKWIQNGTNLLYTKANNRGLKQASGKYFLVLNPDTTLPPTTLKRMYSFIDANKKIGLAGCRQINEWGKILPICHRYFTPYTQILTLPLFYKFAKNSAAFRNFTYADWDRLSSREVDTIPGSFMFGRSDILNSVGLLNETMPMFYSDDDFCLRVNISGYKIWYNAAITITHFTSKTISRSPIFKIMTQGQSDMVSYTRKHHGVTWATVLFLLTKLSLIASVASYSWDYVKFTFSRVETALVSLRDARRFQRLFPQLIPRLDRIQAQLIPAYKNYITKVSHPEMAISLELAAFLYALCETVKPKTVVDLGSGFSSYVFRIYAKANKDVTVYSVDDNKKWLRKTATFLKNNRLSVNNLYFWPEFNLRQRQFDLVLHDLGDMNVRSVTIANAVSLVKPGGYLVLDDLHFAMYRPYVKQEVRQNGGYFIGLRQFTKDQYGRYAALFRKPGKIRQESEEAYSKSF